MYCYFRGDVDYCCESCDNCEYYEEGCESLPTNDDTTNEEDNNDVDCECEFTNDLISRESLLNAIYDFIEEHRHDNKVLWDGNNWLLTSDDVKEIIRNTE